MTNASRQIIIDALKDYKTRNLVAAREACERVDPRDYQTYMRFDAAIERALEEIAVAQ